MNSIPQSYRSHFKQTFRLALPVMLSQVGHIMVGIIDSIMVGQLGTEPLAASAFANSIFHVFLMFGIGVSYGITPLVAQAEGEGDENKITRLLRNGLVMCSVTGLLLFGLMLITKFLLPVMGQPAIVVDLGTPYFLIIGASIIPLMFFQNFKQFSEGMSVTKQIMYITIAANLVNVGLNYLLIYGKFGFPELGLNGAGWATLIARIGMAIVICIYIYKGLKFKKFSDGFNVLKVKATLIKPMLKIGIPSGTQFMFEVGAFSVAAILIGTMGAKELAAHQIAISLVALSYMMATGVSAAATVRVGNQFGKGDGPNLLKAGYASFILSIIVMASCAVIYISFNGFFPTLYINEPEVIKMASSLIVVAGFFQLSDGIQVVGLGALRGMSDVKMPTVITLIAYWVLAIPISYLFGFVLDMGPAGVWYGLSVGLTIAAICLFIRFRMLSLRFIRKNNL